MCNKTKKIIIGSCMVVMCLSPININAYVMDDNNINIEEVQESCSFSFVPVGSISIKTNKMEIKDNIIKN